MTLSKKPGCEFMDSMPRQILAEIANVEAALRNLEEVSARQERTVVELAAIGVFLQRD